MAEHTLPGGLVGGFPEGYRGWDEPMNQNLLRMSVLTQARVKSRTTAIAPVGVQGDVFIVPANAAVSANAIAYFDEGAWFYEAPEEGFRVYVKDTASFVFWDGNSWEVEEAAVPTAGAIPALDPLGTGFESVQGQLDYLNGAVADPTESAGIPFILTNQDISFGVTSINRHYATTSSGVQTIFFPANPGPNVPVGAFMIVTWYGSGTPTIDADASVVFVKDARDDAQFAGRGTTIAATYMGDGRYILTGPLQEMPS